MTFRDPRETLSRAMYFAAPVRHGALLSEQISRGSIDGGFSRYWMRMERWRAWCEKNGAVAVAMSGNEKTGTAGPHVPFGAALRKP
jgi:hypothetical protein